MMSSFVSRLVACLVAVVAILQLVHLVLLNQLESRRLNQLSQIQQQFLPQHHEIKLPDAQPLKKRKLRVNQLRGDFNEHEQFINRLFRDDEGTIVDSTGEYRVVFDIAGPQRDSTLQQTQQLQIVEKPPSVASSNTDDFSIDEDIAELEHSPSEDVTLVTHAELNSGRKHLLSLVERWNGPISLVLFATNTTSMESTMEFIAQARLCSDAVRQYVNFHVVFPLVETHLRYTSAAAGGRRVNNNKTKVEREKNRKFGKSSGGGDNNENSIINKSYETECQYFQTESSKNSRYSREELQPELPEISVANYPANLLRNVARKRAATDYSLVMPIDMLPSEGLRGRFQKFIKKRKDTLGDKTVFVIPAFETKNGETPENKRELLKLANSYQARPYHFELCWKCQVHSDYESWGRESGKDDALSVMYEVLWKDPWEPFFIAANSVPLFDEGFRHLTFDRLSQLCELHVAGFKFAVFNEAFLVHPGYITPPPFQPSKTPNNLDTSRARFRQFKHELKNKYPHSTRRCY